MLPIASPGGAMEVNGRNLTLIRDQADLALFVLSVLCEWTFPGRAGRLRSRPIVDGIEPPASEAGHMNGTMLPTDRTTGQ